MQQEAPRLNRSQKTEGPLAHVYPVILSGGSGSRLWPLSRSHYPKQFYPLTADQTLLQQSALRLPQALGYASPLIVCSEHHRFIVAEQLRQCGIAPNRIVLEPVGRNTAPAAAVAALCLLKQDPEAILLVLPADHLIAKVEVFNDAVSKTLAVVDQDRLVSFGIEATEPHTGYGYVKQGPAISADAFAVEKFIEKPSEKAAAGFLAAGGYHWNSGIFIFSAQVYLQELGRFHPDILAACEAAVAGGGEDLGFFRLDPEAFERCPSDSIDYAVMEKTDKAAVLPVTMGWNDIGSWTALWETGEKDDKGNLFEGDVLAIDVKNSHIRAEDALVAAVGLDNVTVIQTKDAVLVLPSDRAQDVKSIVDRLKQQGRDEHKFHVVHYRPWGSYQTLDFGARFQVKRLIVKPGQSLSLQMHHHRSEHWVVVSGTAKITVDNDVVLLSENQSTYIPVGSTHRLENPGMLDLEVIEVQSGSYLGEDDIVRFDDIYDRDAADPEKP